MKTEIVKNQPFVVRMERSYVNCLYQGMRMGMEHVGAVWKSTWPLFIISLFLPFPLCLLCYAGVAALLPNWSEQGVISQVSARQYMKQIETRRVMKQSVGIVAILLMFVAMVAFVAAGVVAFGWPLWVLCVVLLAVLLLLLPLEWCRLQVLFGNATLVSSFSHVLIGLRHGGKLFAFYTLRGFTFLVVGLLAATPLVIQGLVLLQIVHAHEMGDVAKVPMSFWPLLVCSYVLFQMVLYHIYIVASHAEYLLWGSISAGEAEARSVEEIPTYTEAER